MSRLTRDEWGLALAAVTAARSTCCRRSVGCVLVDDLGHVLATGYNGVAAGQAHCNEWREYEVTTDMERALAVERGYALQGTGDDGKTCLAVGYPYACPGAGSPSGTNLDGCRAIHAEQNALLQCRDVRAIHTCYVTASPCLTCVKLLLNTGCRRIVFAEPYPHPEARELWRDLSTTREWVHLTKEKSP